MNLAFFSHRIGEARCLCVLGYVLMSQYDYKRCLEHYDTSLRLFDAQGGRDYQLMA